VQETHPGESQLEMLPQRSVAGISQHWRPTQERHHTLGHQVTLLSVQLSEINASKPPKKSDSTDAELPHSHTFGSTFISASTRLLHQSSNGQSFYGACPHKARAMGGLL